MTTQLNIPFDWEHPLPDTVHWLVRAFEYRIAMANRAMALPSSYVMRNCAPSGRKVFIFMMINTTIMLFRRLSVLERIAVAAICLLLYTGLCWLLYWPFVYGARFLYLIFKP